MKVRRLLTGLLAGLLATGFVLGAAGCGSNAGNGEAVSDKETSSTDNKESQDLKPVRLGIVGTQDTYVLLEFAALPFENGYLEEELNAVGYTLEPTYFAGAGPEINEAMASGELDVAIYGDLPIFVTKSNGIDTTVVASVNSEIQYSLIAADDEIKEPKDLEGKNVVVGIGTIGQYFWESYVKENDLDISKINVINSTDLGTLLLSGDADVAVGATYTAEMLNGQGVGEVFDTSDSMSNWKSSELVTVKTDYLEQNPDVAVAINKALIRAYDDALNDPQQLYDASESPYITSDMWKNVYGTNLNILNPEITDDLVTYFNDFNDWLYDGGLITTKVDVDTLYDKSYYEQALEELGK